jgi:hypothetical protein
MSMGEAIQFPRSGIWHLRSKQDPRWNRKGQYSSLLGDPPLAIPTEAQEAVAELRSTLDSDPPDDLQTIALPYPRPKLKKLFDFNAFATTERQVDLHQLAGEGGLSEMSIDSRAAEVCLGKPGQPPTYRLAAQFLGFLSLDPPAWQWGWVCEEKGSLDPAALKSVQMVREYGKHHDIPEFSYAEITLGTADDRPWFNGDYLAMISAHICHADFYISGPVNNAPELVMYWLLEAPQVPPQPMSESRRMASAISQAMAAWANAIGGSSGREILRAYAEHKGCRLSEIAEHRLQVEASSGGSFFVDFDESGDISGLEIPAERQEPKKASWLNRLFGGGR